ncbi:MAG: hypothetical protein FWG05_05245, partial [Kiritimatiellaeota bacterium]|nr:hypothetical protein [Kiritimatiellota bacterium]
QAWVGDIVGIGRITNVYDASTQFKKSDYSFVEIEVETYWRGDPGKNTLKAKIYTPGQPPITNIPTLFFLTKYDFHNYAFDSDLRIRPYVYNQNLSNWPRYDKKFYGLKKTKNDYWFVLPQYSWVHVDTVNPNIIAFASNLVYSANSDNIGDFYKTARYCGEVSAVNELLLWPSNWRCSRYISSW